MGRRDGFRPVSFFVGCLGCVYTIPYAGMAIWLALLFVQTEVVSLLAFSRPFLYLRVKSYAYVISNHTHLVNERNDKSRGSIYMSKHTFTAI